MSDQIIIYSSYNCGYCDLAKKLLDQKKIKYQEINIQDDPSQRDIMLKRANGKRTVPQIFFKELHIGGFEELNKLEMSGTLDKILNEKQFNSRLSSAYIKFRYL